MYVETDFLVALLSSDDWLHERAKIVLEDAEEVTTSLLAYAELFVHAYEPGAGIRFDVPTVTANLLESVPIEPEENEEVVLTAAVYLNEHEATPFDALHAAIAEANTETICSSDQIYDELGLTRRPLAPGDGAE